MPINTKPQIKVKTAENLFGVIELLRDNGECTLSEIAEGLNIAKSTAHNHVTTLVDKGYVVQSDAKYRLSFKFLDFGTYVRSSYSLADIVSPMLVSLANTTEGLAELSILENGFEVSLDFEQGPRSVQTVDRIGKMFPAHATAAGKAMLSEVPLSELEDMVPNHGLTSISSNTITDFDDLLDELAKVKERGVAFNNGELVEGIRAVAAPLVTDDYGQMAISVAGPTEWMRGDRFKKEIPQAILEFKNEAELKHRYESI